MILARRLMLASTLGASIAALAAPAVLRAQPKPEATNRNIADALAAQADFEPFLGFVQQSGLMDVLRGTGPLTLFAPTAAAFSRAPAGLLADLLGGSTNQQAGGDPVRLRAVVQTHYVTRMLPIGMLRGSRQEFANANAGILVIDGRADPISIQLGNRVGGTG
jgi:uncharacterized surface protein with fasciclin (FAS1) repeats